MRRNWKKRGWKRVCPLVLRLTERNRNIYLSGYKGTGWTGVDRVKGGGEGGRGG